jgi:hypothetical protein
MSELDQKQEKTLKKYADGVEQLEAALAGLSEADLDRSREQGKWTTRQIVHHIADAEDLWETCIKAALANSGCTFDIGWYIPDNKCAEPLDYANRPIEDVVELFKAVRHHVVQLVKHLPGAWDRTVVIRRDVDIPEGKEFTVGGIIGFQVIHLARHLQQIRESR